MEKQKPMTSPANCNFEEMKIYTPRSVSQMQKEAPAVHLPDQAPVRIYERPLRQPPCGTGDHHEIG